jgi:hypothetical protein
MHVMREYERVQLELTLFLGETLNSRFIRDTKELTFEWQTLS